MLKARRIAPDTQAVEPTVSGSGNRRIKKSATPSPHTVPQSSPSSIVAPSPKQCDGYTCHTIVQTLAEKRRDGWKPEEYVVRRCPNLLTGKQTRFCSAQCNERNGCQNYRRNGPLGPSVFTELIDQDRAARAIEEDDQNTPNDLEKSHAR